MAMPFDSPTFHQPSSWQSYREGFVTSTRAPARTVGN